ncbi:MAG: uridine kinase, partial [Gemmatimonadetes bacterium]|nr:uridine kinase [Gemmatimonadota bacterium]
NKPIIVGIAGGTASGKTTVVQRVVDALGEDRVTVIQHDSYYRDRSSVPPEDRLKINYDHPDALETSLLVEHLRELRAGRSIERPVYDFANHTRRSETVQIAARAAVLVEGILILAEPELRDLLDIRVFVDADSDLRLMRRLERDVSERGRNADAVFEQYLETVRPMHLEFVEPSKRWAHIIIPEGGFNRVGVDMLVAEVRAATHE